MDNRERDKMKNTSDSDVNRDSSSRIGNDKSDSSTDFGQKSGQSEKLNEPNNRNNNSSDSGSGSSGDRGSSSGNRH